MVIRVNETLKIPRAIFRHLNSQKVSGPIDDVVMKGELIKKDEAPKEIYEWLLSLADVRYTKYIGGESLEYTLVTLSEAPAKATQEKSKSEEGMKTNSSVSGEENNKQTLEVAPQEAEPSKRGRKKSE